VGIASGGAGSIYPFPNVLNTGVPGGTASLPTYTGPTTITTAGTVISGYQINSSLDIAANNVTVKNCYFNNVGGTFAVSFDGNGSTLQNCEINGGSGGGDAVWIGGTGNSVTGCNIYSYAKDLYLSGDNITVTGNYLHGIVSSGEHAENIFIDGNNNGTTQTGINISNNTCACNQTLPGGVNVAGPIFISSDFGEVSGVTINNNIMVGGGFTLFFGTNANVANIITTNNILGVGNYGYQYSSQTTNGSTFSGNVDLITGQVIRNQNSPAPNPNILIASFADSANPSACFHIPNSGGGSSDSATFAQNLANQDTITLKGCTAGANVVQIYDGVTLLGTTRAAATGIWTYKLTGASGPHRFTAKDTKTGITSPVFPVTLP
jgi:hypothetical protein